MGCNHPKLQFGSGDYYIFCHDCHSKWVRHGHDQREYGHDKDGKPIGAEPEEANKGFTETDPFRVKQ